MGKFEELIKKGKGNIDKAIAESTGENQFPTWGGKTPEQLHAVLTNELIKAGYGGGRAWDKDTANKTQSGADVPLTYESEREKKKLPPIGFEPIKKK